MTQQRGRTQAGRTVALGAVLLTLLAALFVACGDGQPARDEALSKPAVGAASDGARGSASAGAAMDLPGGAAVAESKRAASAPGAAPMPGVQAPAAADTLGRKIIRNGSMDIEVESVAGAFDRVGAIASGAGGYVSESSFFGSEQSRGARLTLRVPAGRYDEVLANLRGIAKEVRSVSSQTQDVTGEVTDLQAALRNSRAVEAQYLELLGRAQGVGDILQVQERLAGVRGEIERLQGRIALLERLSDMATISVELIGPAAAAAQGDGPRTPAEAARAAWDASLDTLSALAVVAVAATVYSWWLTPAFALLAVLGMRALRARRRTAEATHSAS